MVLPNLVLLLAHAIAAERKIAARPILNAEEKKESLQKMRPNGSSAKLVLDPATAKGKSKGKGKDKGKAGGNRNWKGKGESGKPPCADWSKGNGYCKWADSCRFSHDGPKGGKRKASTSLATKGSAKKQKKQMMSMLVQVLDDVEEKKSEPKEKELSAKGRLMQIVRGNGKLVGMVTSEGSHRNYVPSRPQPVGRTVLMIGGSAR